MKYEAILFDLDGTLIDSAPDLINALDATLADYGLPAADYEQASRWVSHGAGKLLELGFNNDYPLAFAELRQIFLEHYRQQCTGYTVFYPGVVELLSAIEASNTPWGIMTNKPTRLTQLIAKHFDFSCGEDNIVCGDTMAVAKPDPAPLLLLAQRLAVNPQRCVYIGDCDRDIIAGKRAGMTTIACAYGYIPAHDDVNNWGADTIVQSAAEILPCIQVG